MLYIFADDAKMYCHIIDVADKLQKGIENCVKWTKKWQVTLNIDKCNFISVHHHDIQVRIYPDSSHYQESQTPYTYCFSNVTNLSHVHSRS